MKLEEYNINISDKIKEKLRKIKFIFTDFDGTLTDNRVIIDETGKESVICSRADGQAINRLKKKGYKIICVSTEANNVVIERCKKLKINCFKNIKNKRDFVEKYCKDNNIKLNNILFIGNSYNDIDLLKVSGLSICVSDSVFEVKKISDIILKKKGGEGVLEELFVIIKLHHK